MIWTIFERVERSCGQDNNNNNDTIKSVETEAIELLSSQMTPDNNNDAFVQALAAAVWYWSIRHANDNNNNKPGTNENDKNTTAPYNTTILNILQPIVNDKKVVESLLSTVPQVQWLQPLWPGVNLSDLAKKVRIHNTNTHYRQFKFNLLSEDCQGYSKFLYSLPLFTRNTTTTTTKNTIVPQLQQQSSIIIGCFSLDPNRCLDMVLDVLQQEETMENRQPYKQVIQYLTTTGKLPQLLGFRLRHNNNNKATSQTIDSLFDVPCWLCSECGLDVQEVVPYLCDDSHTLRTRIHQCYLKWVQSETVRIQKLGRVSLSSSTGGDQNETTTTSDNLTRPCQELLVVQWIQALVGKGHFALVQHLLSDADWSELFTLFPQTLGVAFLDDMAGRLQQEDENMQETKTRLQLIFDSGCILLRPILYSQLLEKFGGDQDFLQTFLLPSLSLFQSNPSFSLQVWKHLEALPYQTRYHAYSHWKGAGLERAGLKTGKPLWLSEGEMMIGKSARYALKRLSKDTLRDMSKAVAKCCHSHPLVVFTTILNQIESYDNLVQVMVDALRFVTPLSLDVLGYCVLQRLSGSSDASRSRMNDNGMTAQQWLQSLEAFTGAFYKRYPKIEFQGILHHILGRLKDGHVMELGVLRTLLKSSGGWGFADYSPIGSLNMTQIEGRAGSILLQRETMSFGIIEDIDRSALTQVRKVLQEDSVGVSLLILLAQVQHQIVFGASSQSKPVKLIGNLVDTSQTVLSILLDFMTDDFNEEQKASALAHYGNSLPSLEELRDEYQVNSASSWMLHRPLLRDAAPIDSVSALKSWSPPTTWEHVTPKLFEVFFSKSLYDIFCPDSVYLGEISRLEKEVERLTHESRPPQDQVTSPRPDISAEKSDDKKAERAKNSLAALKKDRQRQKTHVETVQKEIASAVDEFFVSDAVSKESAVHFFASCVHPRCMQGPDDALYCAKFIALLHKYQTRGFGSLYLFDFLITALSRSLYGLTEGEASSVAILLHEVWKSVSAWRFDDSAFDADLDGSKGSFMSLGPEHDPQPVTNEQFKNLYNTWQRQLGETCLGCLRSPEYMHLRNCLLVLTRMVDVYPTNPRMAEKFMQALEPLQDESTSLPDIRAAAQAYNMQLVKARDDGVWKEESASAVRARQAKVEADAVERQKKAQQRMAEMKKDQDKITEEIGERDPRDRRGGVHGPARDRYDHGERGRPRDDGRNPGGNRDDRWQRDRAPPGHDLSRRRPEDDTVSRRARVSDTSAREGRKRGRPESPAELGEKREEAQLGQKRTRAGVDENDGRRRGASTGRRRHNERR